MINYNLTDIHFHTNDSFDAYENISKRQFDLTSLIDEINCDDTNLKLLCKTDHNVLNYSKYLTLRKTAMEKGVSLLPGIEVNTHEKIHWLFIFNDKELSEQIDGSSIGELLDEKLTSLYNYSIKNGSINERKVAQETQIDVDKFIKLFNQLRITYLAIPHFVKSNGFFDNIKSNPSKVQILNYMILDNIIVGFESKNQEQELIYRMVTTQEHLIEKKEMFDKGEITDVNEVDRRKEHLDFLHDLNQMFESNDTAMIYGSDYHGKGTYTDENLFFIKSNADFEGLKFALLDPYSRIFSDFRLKKFSKESNYVIDKINIKGYDNPIELGDGLNSIIGPRGSGKTYLINAIIGNISAYSTAKISKELVVDSVILQGGYPLKNLETKHYDIITQKNSLSGSKSMNIYNILSEAPYNYNEFSAELSRNFSQDKIEKKIIGEYFGTINKLIELYSSKYEMQNNVPDFTFIDNYNRFYESQSDELKLNSTFIELLTTLSKSLDDKKSKIEKLRENLEFINKTSDNIDIISKYREVKTIDLLDKLKVFSDNLNEYPENIHKPLDSKLNSDYERIKKVSLRLKNITTKLKDKASNTERVLADSVSNIMKYIGDTVELLSDIRQTQLEVQNYPLELSDITEYTFSQDEFEYKIKIVKSINLKSIDKSTLSEIFKKFNCKVSENNYMFKSFHNADYGNSFYETYKNFDGRFKLTNLEVPNIKEKIFLKVNEEDFKEWDALSPGERSDILLNIVLDNSSKKILIIDQPEDDLDNEMIYKTIVKKLRKLKHKKQIIVVSHNANVVITGDSDLIITCQNYNNDFRIFWDNMESNNIYDYSSMNTPKLADSIINIASLILDGGKEALKRRVKKLGYKKLFFEEEGK